MEENEFVDRVKNGDNSAFDYLDKKYRNKIYAYFMNKIGNPDVADELTQNVFIKMCANIDKYDKNKSPFYNFVWMNVKQVMIDYIRSKKTIKSKRETDTVSFSEINEIDIVSNDDEDADRRKEEIKAVNDMMSDLSDYQRTVLRLFYFEGKSEKEIAKIVGKGDGAVRSVIHRAKKTLDKIAREKHPEIAKRYGIKMIIMLAIGLTAVTGLVYATYKIYSDYISNKYTLSQLREEVPESVSIITKDEALNKINYYLDVFGEDNVRADEIKLVRDMMVGSIYWKYENDSKYIQIDSKNGNLVVYNSFEGNKILDSTTIDDLYKKLNLPSDYEMCNDNSAGNLRFIDYAKRYGDIYNKYESVKFSISNNRIQFVSVLDYPYEDTEILISKERALEIAKENDIDVEEIELSIEILSNRLFDYDNELYEKIDLDNVEEQELNNVNINSKMVWKVITKDSREYLIDINTGEIVYKSNLNYESKNS